MVYSQFDLGSLVPAFDLGFIFPNRFRVPLLLFFTRISSWSSFTVRLGIRLPSSIRIPIPIWFSPFECRVFPSFLTSLFEDVCVHGSLAGSSPSSYARTPLDFVHISSGDPTRLRRSDLRSRASMLRRSGQKIYILHLFAMGEQFQEALRC